MVHQVTTIDNYWQQVVGTTSDSEWQQVITNDSKWYNEGQWVLQRETEIDKEIQRVAISANFTFFFSEKEVNLTTKHSIKNPLNIEENLLN